MVLAVVLDAVSKQYLRRVQYLRLCNSGLIDILHGHFLIVFFFFLNVVWLACCVELTSVQREDCSEYVSFNDLKVFLFGLVVLSKGLKMRLVGLWK